MLVVVALAYYRTRVSRTVLFWAAFILGPRPLGAVVGDFRQAASAGGLAFSRYTASAVLMGFILTGLLVFRQRATYSPLDNQPDDDRRMRVLLVEDDTMIGEAVQAALKDAAYAVDWVRDGRLRRPQSRTQAYDFVLRSGPARA